MLSIIIPTYNSERTIEIAIRSVLAQLYSDWEILIIDGGSSDSTVSIANSFHDNRIMVTSESDRGIYDAMNKGIGKAKGDWLYFMGSDDSFVNECILSSLFPCKEQADIIYGDVEAEHLCKRHYGEWRIRDIEFNRCHQAIFYRRFLFHKYGLYDLQYIINADYAFNLKVFFNNRVKTIYRPLKISYFSSGGASSHINDSAFVRDFSMLVLNNLYWKLSRSQKIYYLKDYVNNKHKLLERFFPDLLITILKIESNVRLMALSIFKRVLSLHSLS